MLVQYESARLARQIDQYQFDLETQIRVEREILQAQESMPSMYGPGVSVRARDAWEARLWANMEAHRHFRVRDQAEVCSDRPGRRLHIVQFIRILNTLPRRRFLLNSFSIRSMKGFSVSRGGAKPQYIMALDDGIMPEWSRLELDDHGLPKRLASRGWRTVLLTMLDMGLITEDELQNRFGFASGVSGSLFRKYLFEHRNRKFADGETWKEQARLKEAGQ